MTDKQEKIRTAALELFANEGYNAVSTRKVAEKAGVSEGLIFRHFENKKGLLDALMKDVELRLNQAFAPIIFELDPQEVIRKTIELPFTIDSSEYDFWRLQFKLKWEPEYYNPRKMKPLIDKLTDAFGELNFKHPEQEARFLEQILDTLSIGILREGLASQLFYKNFLFEKYNL